MSRSALRRVLIAAPAAVLVVLASFLLALPALAGAATVTDGGDSGAPGQLRQVIAAAAPGDFIDFAPGVTQVTLESEIAIEKDLSIFGNGTGATAISASGETRLFTIVGSVGASVLIEDLELSGGRAPDGSPGEPQSGPTPPGDGGPGEGGGAILNQGSLELVAVTFAGNVAGHGGTGGDGISLPGGDGGDGGRGGAIANEGHLTVVDSRFVENHAGIAGSPGQAPSAPALGHNGLAGYGGAIWNSPEGRLTIENSTFESNHAAPGPNGVANGTIAVSGGAGGWGGAIRNDGEAGIGGSTFLGNEAGEGGPGVSNVTVSSAGGTGGGGGAISTSGTLWVTNSTFASNSAGMGGTGGPEVLATEPGDGGGGGDGGALSMSTGEATIAASTITGNFAGAPGAGGSGISAGEPGFEGSGGGSAGIPAFRATIVANNSGLNENCYGSAEDLGGNIVFPTQNDCVGFALADPEFAAGIADNGGPTPTIALGPDSAALGAVPPGSCLTGEGALLTVDQRGEPRPAPATEANCDAGAYESSSPSPAGPPAPPPGATAPAPNVRITKKPRKVVKTKTKRAKVRFSFSADVAGASFECKIDKTPFTRCTSPQGYRLKAGRHTFRVRAVAAGQTGPEATATVKVKRVKRNRRPGR